MRPLAVPVPSSPRALAALAALAAVALCACDDGDDGDASPPDATPGDAAGADAAPADAGVPADPFRNVTAAAGVVHANLLGPERFIGSGVAWLDRDADGDPDLFLAGDTFPSALFDNRGDGTFEDATAEAGLGALDSATGAYVADVDDDGDPDLYVLRAGPDRLYVNDGSGTFADETTARGLGDDATGAAAAFGDYDGDGWLDLFVGTYLATPSALLPFPERFRGAPNRLYHGTGGGSCEEVATPPGGVEDPTLAAAWTDLDFDGDVDLWVVNDFGPYWSPNRFWRNDGGGAFTETSAALGLDARMFGMCASPADADADGDLDLYASNLMANAFFVQAGDGTFADDAWARGIAAHGFHDPAQGVPAYPSYDPANGAMDAALATFMATYAHPETFEWGATGWASVWLDFDQDGWLDLFVANGFVDAAAVPEGRDQPDMLFRGTGGGAFVPAAPGGDAWDRGEARGAAAADYDGDGDLDLAVGRVGLIVAATAILLENRAGAAAGAALRVRLEGTLSNRDGIGARVVLTADGGAFVRVAERTGGGGFLGSGAPELHFGLGARGGADAVDVYWPSGLHDRFGPLAAGTTLVAVEGDAPAP